MPFAACISEKKKKLPSQHKGSLLKSSKRPENIHLSNVHSQTEKGKKMYHVVRTMYLCPSCEYTPYPS